MPSPTKSGLGVLPVFGLSVLSALCFFAAFPPWEIWGLVLFAPIPLALACRLATRARTLFMAVFATQLVLWLVIQSWVIDVTLPGYFAFSLYLAVFCSVQALCLRALCRGTLRLPLSLSVPLVLVGFDWVRGGVIFDGYPWYLWGQPLIECPPLAGLAMLGGVAVPEFIALAASGLVAELLLGLFSAEYRPRLAARSSPGVLILLSGGVMMLLQPGSDVGTAETRSILMVQTNLPTSNKIRWGEEAKRRDVRSFMELSSEGVRLARESGAAPDLVVWPETMLPSVGFEYGDIFTRSIEQLVDELDVPFLVGTGSYPDLRVNEAGEAEWDREYNSAYLVTPSGAPYTRVDKVFLTPFGETMPYISNWAWLETQLLAFGAEGMAFQLDAGATSVRPEFVPRTPGDAPVHFAVPICFEDTMPEVVRAMVWSDGARVANILINISNDGWFGTNDAGRAMHTLCARWRAIENDLWVVRVANTGESVVIDPEGSIADRLATGTRTSGTRLVEVGVSRSGPTAFARLGETFGLLCGLAMCMALVVEWVSRRHQHAGSVHSDTPAQGGAA
jgi:apolipoprotein N-acyltransferase